MINADKYWLEETLTYCLPGKTMIAREKTYSEAQTFHGRISCRTQTARNEINGIDISDFYYLSCREVLPPDTMVIRYGVKWSVLELYRKAGKHSGVNFYHLQRI